MRTVFPVAFVALALLVACGPQLDVGDDPEILAAFEGGQITTSEVDERVLSLPAGRRPKPGEDLQSWYDELLRRMAVEELLLGRAKASDAEYDPEFTTDRDFNRRELTAELCAGQILPKQPAITTEELRQAYEEKREYFKREDARRVYHIFRRRTPGESDADLGATLDILRDRVLNGEGFTVLAAEHSDSETRHKAGLIGWIRRGDLDSKLDQVIFGLEEGVPSTPVLVPEGGHIFFVDRAFDRRLFTFEEVKGQLLAQLRAERRQAAMAALEKDLTLPEGSFVPEREQFQEIFKDPDTDALLMRIGDFELSLKEFKELHNKVNRQDAGRNQARVLPFDLLERLRRREIVIHHCTVLDKQPTEEVNARLAAGEDRALINFQRQRELRALIDTEERQVREYYERSSELFSSPPKWKVSLLKVAVTDEAPAVFARLDETRERLDRGDLQLQDLATELGGSISTIDWSSVGRLNRTAAGLGRFIAPLDPGGHTPAFRAGPNLFVARVDDREDATPLAFEDAEKAVRSAYLAQHKQRLYREFSTHLLEQAGFTVFSERLRSPENTGPRDADIDLEELEMLLEADSTP